MLYKSEYIRERIDIITEVIDNFNFFKGIKNEKNMVSILCIFTFCLDDRLGFVR